MTISAALLIRGKSSTTCSCLASHNFVGSKGKAQSRVVGASCSVPFCSIFVVALRVPHSHIYRGENHTYALSFQETIQTRSLNTLTRSAHTTSHVQEASKQSEGIYLEDSSVAPVDYSKKCAKDCAKIHQSASLSLSSEFVKKERRGAWNKGQCRPEETKEKIRARTRQAMEDPKVRERLRKAREGSTQSSETKMKIKSGLLKFWEQRREAKKVRESCVREWEELIADTARRGSDGDAVYQWDSYNILMGELTNAHKKIRIQRARTRKKSADHKRKIAEALRAKWADPVYSKNVRKGRELYLSNRAGASMLDVEWRDWDVRLASTVNSVKQPTVVTSTNKPAENFKDPMTHCKLEKLKQMRSSRHFEEDRKRKDAMERAWVLMAEAKRAADVLEAMNVKDKNAKASLMEAQKLLSEAEHLFENAGLSMDRSTTVLSEVKSDEGARGRELNNAYGVFRQSSVPSLK